MKLPRTVLGFTKSIFFLNVEFSEIICFNQKNYEKKNLKW